MAGQPAGTMTTSSGAMGRAADTARADPPLRERSPWLSISRFIVMAVARNAWMLSVARGWPGLIRGPKPARALMG